MTDGLPINKRDAGWIRHTKGSQCPVSRYAVVDVRSIIKSKPSMLDRILHRPEHHATGAAACFMWKLISEYRIIQNGSNPSPEAKLKIPHYLTLVKS